MNSNLVSKAVRYALVAGAATAMAAPLAFAQDAAQASNQNQNQNANTAQLGKIEVTGSRIKRTSVETAQPVTIVTAQQIKESGLTSIGDVLQQLTQSGDALNTSFNNGGNGQTQIDLRYFGASRVLVLVNGRRWIPQLNGPVDLNEIPISVIDHIEVLQDGASAIYGSDAITGVVNIITVKNYNGAEAHAYLGMYNGHGEGGGWDGKTQEYDFTVGSSGDRAGVMMSADYVNQSPVWAGQRYISKEPVYTVGSQAGSSASPNGRFFLVGSAYAGKTFGTATCAPYNPAAHSYGSCDMTLINSPTTTPTLGNFRNFQAADHYNYAPANYFVTPNERMSLYVQGHYDLADNLTFTSEMMFNKRTSQQALAPSPIFIGLGGYTANGLPIGIGKSNPYNPFGQNLTVNPGSACFAANTCDLLIFSGRRPIEGGFRYFNQNVDTYFFRGGFNGYFDVLGNEWDWDAGYSYGNNYETDITDGLWNTLNLAEALDSPGFQSCSSVPGCVPLNWFGGDSLPTSGQGTGKGSLTPAMLNWVMYEDHAVMEDTMRDYTADITGTLAQLPAGPLAMAAGLEYLETDGFSHPDATTASGNTSGNVTEPTNGKQWSRAEYVEFNIPLLSDVPFAKNVSLDLAERWTQIKWKGGQFGTATYGENFSASNASGRAALRWQATNDLLLRGSWSQGFRAPSISSLYFGNSTNFPNLKDPCAPPPGSYTGGPLPPGCNGVQHTQPNGQIQSTVGGNPKLTPERAISKSVGFVYNPDWLPGWDFSADYYHIDLVNAIGTIPAQQILNGCYINQNSSYCSLITLAGKTISNVVDTNINIGGDRSDGIDISTHYRFPSSSIGDFKLGLNWTFLRSFVQTVPNTTSPTGFSNTELAGTTTGFGGFPRSRANLTLNWNYGDWSAMWDMTFIGNMTAPCYFTPAGVAVSCDYPTAQYANLTGWTHVGRTVYNDVEATYHLDSLNSDFTFGIRNLLDKRPPAVLSAFANSFLPTFYRVPGRFFYVRLGVKF